MSRLPYVVVDALRHAQLDITFGIINLVDRLEWDVAEAHNSPELFARLYAADLGLPGDFVTAIAHSIREQVEAYQKSLGLVEHKPGAPVYHDELRPAFLPPVVEPYRADDAVLAFTPGLNYSTLR